MTRRRRRFADDFAPRGEGNDATPLDCPDASARIPLLPDPLEAGEPGLLRPGQEVRVGALSGNSVTVKSPRSIKPGRRTDLQLIEQQKILSGEIDRCRVIRLEPLCYEAIFVFDQSVEMSQADLDRSGSLSSRQPTRR